MGTKMNNFDIPVWMNNMNVDRSTENIRVATSVNSKMDIVYIRATVPFGRQATTPRLPLCFCLSPITPKD